jgi:CrcB protein
MSLGRERRLKTESVKGAEEAAHGASVNSSLGKVNLGPEAFLLDLVTAVTFFVRVPMQFFNQYLIIGLGGALGSMLRFGLGSWIDSGAVKTGQIFPWGTIVVNITGCFIIGFIATISTTGGRVFLSPLTRQFILIGILGGYTTFSSFSLQTLTLAQDGQWWGATANVLLSVVLCLVGVWLGAMLAGSLNQLR